MGDGLYIGVMSGTSLDGADAVLARLGVEADRLKAEVLGHLHAPFSAPLRDELLALQTRGDNELERAALAGNDLADHYALLMRKLLQNAKVASTAVRAAGVHGQTVRHHPEDGYTIQINSPARIAEATGIAVIADLRARDVAAQGQGAPLVPAFHAAAFQRRGTHRIVVNIGGMANLTDLPGRPNQPVRGWDTGPGNVLIDTWMQRVMHASHDEQGQFAQSGQVILALLTELMEEPWLSRTPPKSTGRDLFNESWLNARLAAYTHHSHQDIAATLTELSARTIASDIRKYCEHPDDPLREVIVCGGGAYNMYMLKRLESALGNMENNLPADFPPGIPVRFNSVVSGAQADALGSAANFAKVSTSLAHGLPPDQIEALAFAWLAKCFEEGRPGSLPEVTGAKGPRILGCRYPA